MTCKCPDCALNPSPTYLPDYRRKCEISFLARLSEDQRQEYLKAARKHRGKNAALDLEAGYLLSLPARTERQAYLALVTRHRGAVERQGLEETALALWHAERRQAAG